MSHRSRLRSGFTLVEVVTFVTTGTVIFMLAIQLLHVAMNISAESKDQLHQQQTLDRLNRDLRADLQSAVGIWLANDDSMTLKLDNGQEIAWQYIQGESVSKIVRAVESNPAAEYRLSRGMRASFGRGSSSDIGHMIISRSSEDLTNAARLERKIEFRLAADAESADADDTASSTANDTPAEDTL